MQLRIPKVGKPKIYTWSELKRAFPAKLPHYKKIEMEELKRFVDLNILPGDYVFDFRIPYQLTESEKLLSESEQRMLIALKSFRIDALVETKDEVWVLEVCRGSKLSYTGKLIGYSVLYRDQFKPAKRIRMGIITLEENIMIMKALEMLGISYFKVTI